MFDGVNVFGDELGNLRTVGIGYTMVFLLINKILMLNFLIAILSDTYTNFMEYKDGLYLNELIKNFHVQDWDDQYGCLICS